MRLRTTQQPAALTAKRLFEGNRPCTDRKCHVALKQRKDSMSRSHPPVSSNQGINLRAMQQVHTPVCLIRTRKSASARSWLPGQRKLEIAVFLSHYHTSLDQLCFCQQVSTRHFCHKGSHGNLAPLSVDRAATVQTFTTFLDRALANPPAHRALWLSIVLPIPIILASRALCSVRSCDRDFRARIESSKRSRRHVHALLHAMKLSMHGD